MKANVKARRKSILLSVGMIVKNEERHLESCLKALKPFLDTVRSELIIVDTGSTDSTREIARRYADRVIDFEWCNDFSAARNAGVAVARGEWFMFIDADEYLDKDFDELTKFFSYPELYNKYNSASILLRSYTSADDKLYTDFLGSRFTRLLPGTRFEGLIHESLPMPQPHGFFSTILHHYGYKYKSDSERSKKFDRNYELLLEEYKQNPDDLRTLSHIYDCCNDSDKKVEYLTRAYEIAKDKPLSMYSCAAYLNSISFYSDSDRPRSIEYAREFLGRDGALNRVAALQISSALGNMLCLAHEYESANEAFDTYFKLYDKYTRGELDNSDLRARGIKGVTEVDMYIFSASAALCLARLNRPEEAEKRLDASDLSMLPAALIKDALSLVKDIAEATGNYKMLGRHYSNMLKNGTEPAIKCFGAMLSDIYYDLRGEKRAAFAKAIGECGGESALCVLMRITALEGFNGFESVLDDFCAVCSDWSGASAEAVWLCMKHGVPLNNATARMNYNDIRAMFPLLCTQHEGFAETALEYAGIFSVASLGDLLLLSSMLETASLAASELRDEIRRALYNLFTSALGDYVLNIYNSEVFNDEDITALPPLHRFGYYMAQAHLNSGNHTEYMKNLRNALLAAPETKDIVSFMMDDYRAKYIDINDEK